MVKDKQGVCSAVVLAANYSYSEQVLTTIKSICYHNRKIKFYLIHTDFPNEWFYHLNKKLSVLDCQIVNARVDASQLQHFHTDISYTVFLRYFVADFVIEEKALYLDCDMVITQDIRHLFETELGDYPVAAVQDLGGKHYFGEYIFNAGLLLINNVLWKKEKVRETLIELTHQYHHEVPSADQSILNLLFKNRWLQLPFQYNCITLHTVFSDYQTESNLYPPIIHYLTERKPWNVYLQTIYREVWWFYNNLDWSDFDSPRLQLTKEMVEKEEKPTVSCFIYTYSCDLLHISYLVQSLPDCHFYIAAPVVVAEPISCLLQYQNVSVASDIAGLTALLEALKEKCHILLDINAGEEVGDIISDFRKANKEVYAFDSRAHGEQGQRIFSQDNPESMVQAIADFKVGKTQKKTLNVLSIHETLDYVLKHHSSIIRYGDGEMDLISGHSIPYQDYHPELASKLKNIMSLASGEQLVICLSDVFENLGRYQDYARDFWLTHLQTYKQTYLEICQAPWYGSTFISRPYMDLLDKSASKENFEKIRTLWEQQDILIVEGATSHSGVGNNLFDNARSVKRIICPSRNAYDVIEEIKQSIRKLDAKDCLILIMLGPTAKVLVYDLLQEGYHALDIGHIDSEYEWFLMGANHKVKLPHKHTAEYNYDENIEWLADEVYEKQIVVNLVKEANENKKDEN